MKRHRVGKVLQLAMELDFAFGKSILQCLPEFCAENERKDLLRQKEAMPWIHGDPSLMIER